MTSPDRAVPDGDAMDSATRSPAAPQVDASQRHGDPSGIVLERVFRAEYGRIVASLVRVLGGIDPAEEAAADALTIAADRWPRDGVPPNPGAWLMTTARHRGIDRLRREASRQSRQEEAHRMIAVDSEWPPDEDGHDDVIGDDQLRLIFTCCHPALAPAAQVALTLRLLGGLSTPEIARAFLVAEPTMAQRIVRAKGKIRAARIPYRIPEAAVLPDRLPQVLAVIYLIFNEGHTASAGPQLGRVDLAAEAIRLGRLLHKLMPDEPEVAGLLAMMLLSESRRRARTAEDGSLVLLADQDRGLWDAALIDEGQALVRQCLRRGRPGPYQVQAAIQAVHSEASTADGTDWSQIVALYRLLEALTPSPIVTLNRAVAQAEVEGPAAGLAILAGLPLDSYPPFHAVRAELLARSGDRAAALVEFTRAAELTGNPVEKAHLSRRASDLR